MLVVRMNLVLAIIYKPLIALSLIFQLAIDIIVDRFVNNKVLNKTDFISLNNDVSFDAFVEKMKTSQSYKCQVRILQSYFYIID
jgi:hypothetical protein